MAQELCFLYNLEKCSCWEEVEIQNYAKPHSRPQCPPLLEWPSVSMIPQYLSSVLKALSKEAVQSDLEDCKKALANLRALRNCKNRTCNEEKYQLGRSLWSLLRLERKPLQVEQYGRRIDATTTTARPAPAYGPLYIQPSAVFYSYNPLQLSRQRGPSVIHGQQQQYIKYQPQQIQYFQREQPVNVY